jgi:hypothetical protein
MSGMIVHGLPGSPYVRAALLALEEKGAEYELAAMAPGHAETTTALVVPPVQPHPRPSTTSLWPLGVTLRHHAAALNRAAERAVGLAPALKGEPGFCWPEHEADHNGIACEPWPRRQEGTAAAVVRTYRSPKD